MPAQYFQSSDQRLKTDIQSLDASSALFAIEQLNPVSYSRLDQLSQGQQLGFIAQNVGNVFPQLVSTSSPTALTPDGTLTVNYPGLIAPIVKAIQALHAKIAELASTVASFAERFRLLPHLHKRHRRRNGRAPTQSFRDNMSGCDVRHGIAACSNSRRREPCRVPVGPGKREHTYYLVSFSASHHDCRQQSRAHQTRRDIPRPRRDRQSSEGHDLGVKTFLNGLLVSDIVLDTSTTSTDNIEYVATDTNGLTSTRTVYIDPPRRPRQPRMRQLPPLNNRLPLTCALREGGKSENIHARSAVIRPIPAQWSGEHL